MYQTRIQQTAICSLCGTERPVEAMALDYMGGGIRWVCGGIDPASGEDAITDCESKRGI